MLYATDVQCIYGNYFRRVLRATIILLTNPSSSCKGVGPRWEAFEGVDIRGAECLSESIVNTAVFYPCSKVYCLRFHLTKHAVLVEVDCFSHAESRVARPFFLTRTKGVLVHSLTVCEWCSSSSKTGWVLPYGKKFSRVKSFVDCLKK